MTEAELAELRDLEAEGHVYGSRLAKRAEDTQNLAKFGADQEACVIGNVV